MLMLLLRASCLSLVRGSEVRWNSASAFQPDTLLDQDIDKGIKGDNETADKGKGCGQAYVGDTEKTVEEGRTQG